MELFSYKTIAFASEATFKEKGSKFLAFAYPVTNEGDVKEKLELLRKKYFDARHHCYAYMIGESETRFRANDDGEPNHSAGDPILGQIRSKGITNVLIVVVRYFGGVKLGVGGLIAAYKTAAETALKNSKIVEQDIATFHKLEYASADTGVVMKLVKDFDLKILSRNFGEINTLTFELKTKFADHFFEKVSLQQKLGNNIKVVVP
jgi:uncharacterized YigZ family protein